MRVTVKEHHQNKIAKLIAKDLQTRIRFKRHIHGGDVIIFTIHEASIHAFKDHRLGDISPSCQLTLQLQEDGKDKYIPRAGGHELCVSLYEREDGELACRLNSKNLGSDQRYQGSTKDIPTFVDRVGLAIKFFLEHNS